MKAYTVPAVQFSNCAVEAENLAVITTTVIVTVVGSTAGAVASTVVSKVMD